MKRHALTSMHLLLLVLLALGLAACASIARPSGGPKDVTPPEFVSSTPPNGATGVSKQRIDLFFNENVQLDDAFNKVIVSPAQKTTPSVSANGRHVSVEIKDTLQPNTTYTIDFGDAIKDLNEGNILDGFTYAFATGDTIDTLRIAGMVLEARTLEPAQGYLVGIYSNLDDSAITTLPLERIARTNQKGEFTIQNVKAGEYRIFALKDMNRDYHWDRSEDVAFYDVTVSPYAMPIEVVDTLRSAANTDSLVTRAGTAYFPNDVLLSWFNEDYKAQYLKDYDRPERKKITINMSAPADSLPQITIASGERLGEDISKWALLHKSQHLDSLTYWIADSAVLATDSLYLSVKYLRTDTNDLLSWRADTLKFFYKDPKSKKKKKEEEAADTMPPAITFAKFSSLSSSVLDVYKPLKLHLDDPIDTILPGSFRLLTLIDSVWEDIPDIMLEIDSINPLQDRIVRYDWDPGEKYKFVVDSASIFSIYNLWNDTYETEFSIKALEEYSNLVLNIKSTDSIPAIVELLDNNDSPIAKAPVIDGAATFKYLNPGTFYARLFLDANNNGKWDTGNLRDKIQPEEVYYYPKKLNLRKNWDVAQDWDIYETALDLQKPWDIRKNKLKNGEKYPGQGDDDDNEEEEDEFGTGFGGNSNFGPGNRGNNRGGNQQFGRQSGGNFRNNY